MNLNRYPIQQRPLAQRGVALAVGLVALLMLTMLGVSSMNMTSLELKVAGNTQNHNKAFQAASSMLDLVFYASGSDPNRLNFTSELSQSFGPVTGDGISTTAVGVFSSRGSGILCPGNSLRATCNFYRLTATSTHTASNANSMQVLGLYKPTILDVE